MKFKDSFLSPKRDVVIYLLSVLRIKNRLNVHSNWEEGRKGQGKEARKKQEKKKRKRWKGNGRNKLSSDCQGLDGN